jgi:hypothetical protein
MKTATITYHDVYNYGAVLQAFALQQIQLNMSIDNVIIDYSYEKRKFCWRIKGFTLKLLLVNSLRLLITVITLPSIIKQCRNFQKFSKTRLKLSVKYVSLNDLKKNPPIADRYIAGSDQLWNVSHQFNKAFFLDFGSSKVKLASYAVSMGSYDVPMIYRQPMQELLARFDAISVREEEAKDYIETILDKTNFVKVNIDPIFLLSREEWEYFAQPWKVTHKYILCFPMGDSILMNKALKKIKSLTGYRTVMIATELIINIKADRFIRDASPEQFIYLLMNAEYVLTSSFHGTAFCTIFNKIFYSFVGGSAPSRITGLLTRLGLEDRIFKGLEDINTQEIDFTASNEIINKEIISAKEYLYTLFKK